MDNFNKWKENRGISSGNIANLYPRFIADCLDRDIIREYRFFNSLAQTEIFVSSIKDCGFDLIYCEGKASELILNLYQVKTVDNLQSALTSIGPAIDDLIRAYTYFTAIPISKIKSNKVNPNNYNIISDYRKELNDSIEDDFVPKKLYEYPKKNVIFNLYLSIYSINQIVGKKDLIDKFNSKIPDKSLVPTWELIYEEYKKNNLKLTQQLKNPNLFHKISDGNIIKVNLNNSQRNLHCATKVNFFLLTDEDFEPKIKKEKISIRIIKGSQFLDKSTTNKIDVLYGITSLGELIKIRELSNEVFKFNPRNSIVFNPEFSIKNQAEEVQNGIRSTLKNKLKRKSFHKYHSGFLLWSNKININTTDNHTVDLDFPIYLLNGRQSLEVLSDYLRKETETNEVKSLKEDTYVSLKIITGTDEDELPLIAKSVNTQIPLNSASLLLWADSFVRKNIEEFNKKSTTNFVKIRLMDECNDDRKQISIYEVINILASKYYESKENIKSKKLKIPITESSDTNIINDIIKEIKENLYSDGNIIEHLQESIKTYNEVDERLKHYFEESDSALENPKFKRDETMILIGFLFYKLVGKHIECKDLEELISSNSNQKYPVFEFFQRISPLI